MSAAAIKDWMRHVLPGRAAIVASRALDGFAAWREQGLGSATAVVTASEGLRSDLVVREVDRALLRTPPRMHPTLEAMRTHAARDTSRPAVHLTWATHPDGGNFGDWLSPWVIGELSKRSVLLRPGSCRSSRPYLVGIGSVAGYVSESAIVVGTGMIGGSSPMDSRATIVSVRGPLTAAALRAEGVCVDAFGDPGALIRRLAPVERLVTNGRTALVRHYAHAELPVVLPDWMDEISIRQSRPCDLIDVARALCGYDSVVTSAMHVLIACQSYGIPCALVTFRGHEGLIHGDGMKYHDYALGVGTSPITPIAVGLDLRHVRLDSMLTDERISDSKLDEITQSVESAVEIYFERSSRWRRSAGRPRITATRET